MCSFRRKAGTEQSGLCDDARTAPATVYKCALSEFWDRAHYPRYSIIRGKLQMSFGILGFEQKISDNVFHVWYS